MTLEPILFLLSLSAIILYISAGITTSKRSRLKAWPKYRYVLWTAGILSAAVTIIGPLSEMAHKEFIVHMTGHLLLGMLAPLLLVLSAPITLLLRSLNRENARRVAGFLKSTPIRFVSHPVVASLLNIGGLWILYTTSLFDAMHVYPIIHVFVHIHIFLAGYAFTASMIYIDPVSRRFSYFFRVTVFVLALAGHQILAKYMYANPPGHVLPQDAQAGAMLMYYGGDLIDLIIIIIFCRQWYQSSRPRAQDAVYESSH